MDKEEQDKLKQKAGIKAASLVQPGMKLGIGTGSTVAFLIDALGKRKQEEGLELAAIATTSSRSKKQMESWGFKVNQLAEIDQLDLTIDGADRFATNFDGIKGGGGALTLEKNVAVNSKKVMWIVDESKVVDHLSGFALPVEVLPISCEQTFRRFEAEGLKPKWRMAAGKRFVTHYGNYIIDLDLDRIPVPHGLADYLDHTVGVVEHGLFLDMCDEVIIAHRDGEIEDRKK
ncbi:ribose-5-phosphate isomerase RpiA [Lactobacillus sp. ESL0701]|uniref:ribose-5-phosphate isomerase RpiA n=1 Tax=Lactobacillus sp. ESL0701 TaxID=2983217 RepID=UPI0023F869A8|nr:ribose-5-phosphate isomerase RpiA [Lactobacillus sp. ESL0701]MDF7672253.1 ribose-5-phosphate isomerase RpiA [Lactobacillus sp. ESL0701]